MSRNKGHGRNEQERIEGQGGKGVKFPTRKHAGEGENKNQAHNARGQKTKDHS